MPVPSIYDEKWPNIWKYFISAAIILITTSLLRKGLLFVHENMYGVYRFLCIM